MGNSELVTVPAAASALGVSRIVLDRAVKGGHLSAHTFHTGGKNGAFRLIPADTLRAWLKGRKGWHEALKGGATKFHPWGARRNPDTIVGKALAITNGE